MWILWLVVGIIFSVAEILYSGFFLIWFAAGAIAALITSLVTSNFIWQSLVFIVVSLTLLLTLTKRVVKKLNKPPTVATNIDGLIGKKGIVIQAIGKDNLENGLVKLDGEVWTAISTTGEPILKETLVTINAVKGVKLIVSPIINQEV
ncbi:hypothetical protein CS063_04020 [Sporanaerobium hydrogeniformans]|uniref:Uncharacterized protein n=1 Tax=Sporanaerobium hydrogeniformans TaxID=3072179 RepID=A0AC61DF84_9FIRM|nr:NfeD family protein [Sporanaerobium hydrogeniformans]PHV71733.1 hypothetical protein CS063_04020 [Sporanaerobium hydrogeniformans]